MNEPQRILALYNRVMNGKPWHGDSVWATLEGISADQAGRRQVASAHTIWQLVLHMTFWETEVLRRLQGLPGRSVRKLNFPVVSENSPGDWKRTLADFRQSNAAFRQGLKNVDSSRLDKPLAGRTKPLYVELHGVIQHHLYHAGQIALLRRIP